MKYDASVAARADKHSFYN